jgi:hypothetical protein
MGLSVGNSLFTASISNDTINEMLITHSEPHMTIWEKIKDFFFATGETEALNCLFKLCNPEPNLTSSEVEGIFFRLKELVSDGYKERFCHNHIDSSSTGKLHIKDENGNDLLYIQMNGKVCNYTILGKTFIFENNIMPCSPQEHETSIDGLSIIFQEIEPQSPNDNLVWMKDSFYCLSYENNNFNLDFKAFYDDVINYITSIHKGNAFDEWREEEKKTYISAAINKEIDNQNQIFNKNINSPKIDKNDVFECVKNDLGISSLSLDSKCAQSSIKHCVLTLINNNESWRDFIKKSFTDSNSKNIINTDMVNALSNHIFKDLFMTEINLPYKWISIVRCSVNSQYTKQ